MTDDPHTWIRHIIRHIGDDPDRTGVLETPHRVVKSWGELFCGYQQDPQEVLKTFEDGVGGDYVLVKNIEFYSMCEHHMLPFYGMAHIAYVPYEGIVGLSKMPRLVNVYARRLQVQERLGDQIAQALHEHLAPLGVMTVLDATHLCMCARGVEKGQSLTRTVASKGLLHPTHEPYDAALRQEILAAL